MREADLARGELVTELASPRLEQADVDLSEARRGGNRQRGGHVARQAGGRAGDRLAAGAGDGCHARRGRRGGPLLWGRWRGRRFAVAGRLARGHRLEAGESRVEAG